MNPSGSEFTLRVAICDLVERLKRMQHKCTYLEECRNQLVKEVIRLRLQNEWLARQINDSPEISSLPQNIQCYCNQQNLVSNTLHTAHCHLNGQDPHTSSNDSHGSNRSTETKNSNKDESIHLINILNELDREDLENRQDSIRQLTIQMLKDLDNEMKTGQLKTDLINFVKSNLATNDDDDDESLIKFDEQDSPVETSRNKSDNVEPQTNVCSHDYEAFNNNSDYYSNSHNLNIPLEDLKFSQKASVTKVQIKSEPLETNDNKCPMINSNIEKSSMPGPIQSKVSSNLERKESTTIKQISHSGSFGSVDDNLVTQKSETQIISIINSIKNDLKNLTQGVLASSDKLNKIKTRQLRHFFQKQINLDHSANSNLKH